MNLAWGGRRALASGFARIWAYMRQRHRSRTALPETEWFAILLLAALTLFLVAPIVLGGHVATPLDYTRDLLVECPSSERTQLRRLWDVNRYFIPALHLHFRGDFAGWSATWDPHVQLGRPAPQFGGYGKAYPITYLLSFATSDPLTLHAWISVVTVGVLVSLSFLFLRVLGLQLPASFLGAVAIGLNTYSAYWFGFAQLLAWVAWSLGIMWTATLLCRRFTAVIWLGLVFCCYCLIIGARHQTTIYAIYLVVPVVIAALLRSQPTPKARIRASAVLASAVVAAMAFAFPLAHDFLASWAASTRAHSDTSGFIHGSRVSLIEHLGMLWNAFAFGNPSREGYALRTPALNFSPFFCALFPLALITRAGRKTGLFMAVTFFFLAVSVWPDLRMLAIKHLGMGFSRGYPVSGLYLPFFVVGAHVVDALLRDRARRVIPMGRGLMGVLLGTAIGLTAVLSQRETLDLHKGFLALGLLLAAMAAALAVWRSPWIAFGAGVLLTLGFAAPALIHRPPSDVARTSELVRLIQDQVPRGHRIAKFAGAARFLPSNEEAVVDLHSIHSYDSLSSLSYGGLTQQLSDRGIRFFGRNFDQLDNRERLLGDAMTYTAVSAIVSDRRLRLDSWREHRVASGLRLYVAPEPRALVAQIAGRPIMSNGEASLQGPLDRHLTGLKAIIIEQRSNDLRITTSAVENRSLLFVSAQHHRDWIAEAEGRRLETVKINGFYLGVVLPPGTGMVHIQFRPLARLAWLPLVAFAVGFPMALAWDFWRRPAPRRVLSVDHSTANQAPRDSLDGGSIASRESPRHRSRSAYGVQARPAP